MSTKSQPKKKKKQGPVVDVRVRTRVWIDGVKKVFEPGVVPDPHPDLVKAAEEPGNILRLIKGENNEQDQ